MTPLTLKVLASLLHLHGPEATVVSDNAGIDDLLAGVRDQLAKQTRLGGLEHIAAAVGARNPYDDFDEYSKRSYSKWYTKHDKSGVMGPPAPSRPKPGVPGTKR
jgi:hypothetical protein